jgi:hypothetical protein
MLKTGKELRRCVEDVDTKAVLGDHSEMAGVRFQV